MRFRVYDRVDNKFYYPGPAGARFKIDSAGNLITPQGYFGDPNQIIQLSSGVLDKTGVEIYDGDMVEYYLGERKVIDSVKYDPEQLMWVMTGTGENEGTVLQFVKYLDYTIIKHGI